MDSFIFVSNSENLIKNLFKFELSFKNFLWLNYKVNQNLKDLSSI